MVLQVRDGLYTTRELLDYCLAHSDENVVMTLEQGGGYADITPLMDVLQLIYRSLIETRDDAIANGVVLGAIRQVKTFGSSLTRLDIRQESTRHQDVMDAVTLHLDMGSFSEWKEQKKLEFLVKELKVRPLQ